MHPPERLSACVKQQLVGGINLLLLAEQFDQRHGSFQLRLGICIGPSGNQLLELGQVIIMNHIGLPALLDIDREVTHPLFLQILKIVAVHIQDRLAVALHLGNPLQESHVLVPAIDVDQEGDQRGLLKEVEIVRGGGILLEQTLPAPVWGGDAASCLVTGLECIGRILKITAHPLQQAGRSFSIRDHLAIQHSDLMTQGIYSVGLPHRLAVEDRTGDQGNLPTANMGMHIPITNGGGEGIQTIIFILCGIDPDGDWGGQRLAESLFELLQFRLDHRGIAFLNLLGK